MFKISPKTLVLGGIAIAAAAGALKNRDKVAGLIGARSSAPEPPRPEPVGGTPGATPAAAPSNYDLAGPAANTATRVPAPEVAVRDEQGGIDERAEEAAAAAEAAAIGGATPEYTGLSLDEPATEAERPLVEAGEGESEGEELAEADLRDEAEPQSGAVSDAERRIDEVIEEAGNPTVGESIEAVETQEPDAKTDDDKLQAATADDADDAPTSTAKDDEDPSNDGVRDVAANGSGDATQKSFGFAGGKVGGEPELAAEPEAIEEAAEAAGEAGPEIHPDQTSFLEGEEEARPAGYSIPSEPEDEKEEEAPRETPAAEKSSAVWTPPESTSDDDDDDGGSEWQTWSGRAIKP